MRLPHVRLGVYSVMMNNKNGNVVLRLNSVGLKIIWGKLSYVEIGASPRYKGRLCGLCGNYNHDISDDFTTPGGILLDSSAGFAQSWKFGSWTKCKSKRDRALHRSDAVRRKQKRRKELKREKEKTSVMSSLAWVQLKRNNAGGRSRISNDRVTKSNPPSSVSRVGMGSYFSREKKRRRKNRLLKLCGGGRAKWRSRKPQMRQCRILKSQLFSSCRSLVPVARYFR